MMINVLKWLLELNPLKTDGELFAIFGGLKGCASFVLRSGPKTTSVLTQYNYMPFKKCWNSFKLTTLLALLMGPLIGMKVKCS
jgi:hypothetical protein